MFLSFKKITMKETTNIACYFPSATDMGWMAYSKIVEQFNEIAEIEKVDIQFYLLGGAPSKQNQKNKNKRNYSEKT